MINKVKIMNEMTIKVNNLEETERVGIKIAQLIKENAIITLEGQLGVGKTHLAKSIAKGLDINEPVTSPTFTIIKEYEGTLPMYHIDAYRLEFAEDDIGLEEYFNKNGVSVIEWAQFIDDYLPEEYLEIVITYVDETSREFTFKPHGEIYEKMVSKIISRN